MKEIHVRAKAGDLRASFRWCDRVSNEQFIVEGAVMSRRVNTFLRKEMARSPSRQSERLIDIHSAVSQCFQLHVPGADLLSIATWCRPFVYVVLTELSDRKRGFVRTMSIQAALDDMWFSLHL